MSGSSRLRRLFWFSITILSLALFMLPSASADPVLDVSINGDTRHFERDALLARPEVSNVEIVHDVAYGKTMRFRAIPLAVLLPGLGASVDGVLETVAVDGFAAQLPLGLVTNTDPAKAVAWLAIEPADAPWPPLPGKTASAGPFYIVWTGASAATIRSEQWPYQVAKLETQPSPGSRWPALAVDPALPATHPVRAGQALFVVQCLPCHTLNGAGSGTLGPDMNKPMSPTEYMTHDGLQKLIRDPRSVRSWPGLLMPGFTADQMSDREIDLVIEYLAHMAARRKSQ
ncbi:c-type cytochrome [Rhodoplanes sp. Z2-YC6860]|uniref:c-type cytochrome n=1 Tax=Rhodoplanes sp. Z2-YC6860 TaxID=674703 RepID=UPI00078D4FB7|nr:cytochrome c [Rhodoplanes sp. Z2-YC6860]AMN43065.1 signal peptide protein [Rhodoplanes sp. Z2-YC6860]